MSLDPDWQERAACLEQTWFTSPYGRTEEARAICQACPVLSECKTWILTSKLPVPGIVAGLSPEQRDLVECACGTVQQKERTRKGMCWSCYTAPVEAILEREIA
jgi:hypothetical protein